MFRRLVLAIVPLALLAAACSGGDGTDDGVERDASQPTAAPTAEPTAEPPAAVSDIGDSSDSAGEALFGALNPFDLVGGFDAAGGPAGLSQDVDPSLSAALITADDLPADYSPLGDFTFSVPTEYGPMEVAASQFTTGDPTGTDMGSMVMSTAVALPPEAMDDELGDLSDLQHLTEEGLAEMEDLEGLGMGLEAFQFLDASGLGDGGAAFHMEIDLGAFSDTLIAGFGEEFGDVETDLSGEEMQVPDGIGMDIYMFVRGERMLMLMVMWPLDEDPGVDARELADTMDGRAAAAF